MQPRTRPSRQSVTFSPQRIFAMVLRYWYLLRSSWPRLLELIYWPAVQMLMWGFLQLYVSENAGFFAKAGGTFIGAVLLWDILFRGQLGFSISFLEEMWARNMGNLMMRWNRKVSGSRLLETETPKNSRCLPVTPRSKLGSRCNGRPAKRRSLCRIHGL